MQPSHFGIVKLLKITAPYNMYLTNMDDCDDGSDDDIVRNIDRSNDRVMVIMTMEVLMVLMLTDMTDKDSDTVAMMFVISVMAIRMMVGGVK